MSDFEGTAVELVHPLLSLRYLFLATSGSIAHWRGNDDPHTWWEAEERWHVAEVAETIIRKEELLLAKTDEVSVAVYTHTPSAYNMSA